MTLFSRLRRGAEPTRTAAPDLYTALVERARDPEFYWTLGVPDTVDGRFDLIVLHAHLLFRRLRDGGEPAERLSQAVFDYMMSDMDRNLREMGVGDLGVGKRIKAMARAYYGRARAYDAALDDVSPGALAAALARNLLPADAPADGPAATGLADYVRRSIRVLADCPTDRLLAGEVAFAEPVAAPEPA